MLGLHARIGGGEAAVDAGTGGVAAGLPRVDLGLEHGGVGHAVVAALAAEHAALDRSEPLLLHLLCRGVNRCGLG